MGLWPLFPLPAKLPKKTKKFLSQGSILFVKWHSPRSHLNVLIPLRQVATNLISWAPPLLFERTVCSNDFFSKMNYRFRKRTQTILIISITAFYQRQGQVSFQNNDAKYEYQNDVSYWDFNIAVPLRYTIIKGKMLNNLNKVSETDNVHTYELCM
jgi:hypothetical protein